jgi:catechol 2,3-dioxygenase-like lactoylglutathione lyase family enzyme
MTLQQSLGLVSLVVSDYDEALDFYLNKLGFILVEDTLITAQSKRWVVIEPTGNTGAKLLLAKASNPEQEAHIGNQTGGRVFLFLYTKDLAHDYQHYTSMGIKFIREPEIQPHGYVAVFEDLYGNAWDLIEPNASNKSWPMMK